MKYLFSAAALLAATVVADKRDLCSDGSVDDGGNWYCQEVTAITYTGVGTSGSYNRVTNMGTDGTCSSSAQAYSGSVAPLDEEVSVHFRGPIQLKQFAAYTPSTSSKKRSERRSAHARRHARAHAHEHAHHAREAEAEPEAAIGDMVTATINGVVVSWANAYGGGASTSTQTSTTTVSVASASATSAAATYSASVSVVANVAKVLAASVASSSTAAAASATSSSTSSSSSSYGAWTRQAYYDASSGSSNGLVFLNHQGGSGSGVFDYTYGNSLSYASANGLAGASSPQTLEDCTLPSSGEVVIMTDSKCSGSDCGYSRPDTVAYHGFNGPSKAFFFEFQMPDSGETGASEFVPVNMPAIWLLNAQVPRTLQYGKAECSCWSTGCGEFDIFEVLAAGDKRMKSTLHSNVAGGDSDYFVRPESNTIKAVLVFFDNNIHIKVLDDSTVFSDSLAQSYFDDLFESTLTQTKTVSLFAITS